MLSPCFLNPAQSTALTLAIRHKGDKDSNSHCKIQNVQFKFIQNNFWGKFVKQSSFRSIKINVHVSVLYERFLYDKKAVVSASYDSDDLYKEHYINSIKIWCKKNKKHFSPRGSPFEYNTELLWGGGPFPWVIAGFHKSSQGWNGTPGGSLLLSQRSTASSWG